MRTAVKRSRRRAKAQTQKPSGERVRPQAPCKRRTPHGSPEKRPSPYSAASPPTGRGMKEPAPTLETGARAKAPSMEDLWQLPGMMYALDTPSISSSDSLDSFFCVPPMERLYPLHRTHSVGPASTRASISSSDSFFYIPERGPAAMREQVVQNPSGPAQSSKDDQRLVTTAGSNGTLPRVPYKPPTVTEVEAKLRQPGHKIWLYGERVEVPGGVLERDKDMDGDKTSKNVAQDTSSCANKGSSSPVGLESSSPKEMDMRGPTETRSSSPMHLGSTSPGALGSSSPAQPSPQQRVPAGRTGGRASPGPCRLGRCLQEGCARLWRYIKAWWQEGLQSCCCF
ncbi:uncharacterized protein LOC141974061 [Athene noctua]|uniref:uncharacterized protein LOC141974061 n=1 Tax=Athene noctua TaxID=126797 RepID=UPI003EB9E14C